MKIKLLTTNRFEQSSLEAVWEYFRPYINIDFDFYPDPEHKVRDPLWRVYPKRLHSGWIRNNLIDSDYSIVVYNMSYNLWEAKDADAYFLLVPFGKTHFITMKSKYRGIRKRNCGWHGNDEFAGRLRHELMHAFYRKTGTKDNLHEYEYNQKNIDKCLSEIPFHLLT